MKRQFVNSFSAAGEAVDDKFAVKFKKPPTAYKGRDKAGKWFELRLADKTGEITAKYWGRNDQETDRIYSEFAKGDIVHVKGSIQEYPPQSRKYSISVDAGKGTIRKCQPNETSPSDYIATTGKDVSAMFEEAKSMLENIQNTSIRALISKYLEDEKLMAGFRNSPAAMEYHQNYVGGLLEHTLNVMKISNHLCDTHPELDRDLVLAGSFVHDMGKIYEFEISGGVIDVSSEGMLVGHIVIGYDILSEKIRQIPDFPAGLKMKLLHLVLCHHGKAEYGAVKQPQLPEGMAIFHADHADAQLDLYLRLKREANTEDGWIWDKKINGHIYLK